MELDTHHIDLDHHDEPSRMEIPGDITRNTV